MTTAAGALEIMPFSSQCMPEPVRPSTVMVANWASRAVQMSEADSVPVIPAAFTTLAEGLTLMTPFDANASDEATQSFVTKFKERMNGLVPNQFAADGYDVIYAIYNALTAAGVTGNESASEICDALKAQFTTMTVDGLTGTGMHWDENGMISKAPAAVVIENGVYVPMA